MDIPNSNEEILSIPFPKELTIKKRPSSICKSPYVADANETEELLHTPSLGCFGLVEANSKVICSEKKNTQGKCKYVVQLGYDSISNTYISTNPLLANQIANVLLEKRKIQFDFIYDEVLREKTIGNSRFDFILKEKNKTHVVEVKAVPIAFYENVPVKEYKKRKYDDYVKEDKVGIFPVGYKKKKDDPVSERAIKHLQELGRLISMKEIESGTCLFVVGRNDVTRFSPSKDDPHYCKAIKEAMDLGVNIRAVKIEWKDNKAYFREEIPVVIED